MSVGAALFDFLFPITETADLERLAETLDDTENPSRAHELAGLYWNIAHKYGTWSGEAIAAYADIFMRCPELRSEIYRASTDSDYKPPLYAL